MPSRHRSTRDRACSAGSIPSRPARSVPRGAAGVLALALLAGCGDRRDATVADSARAAVPAAGQGGAPCSSAAGITLPAGFCATVFADSIGHARNVVVAPDGVVYVNTWSGRYYGNDKPHAGGFLVALRDTTGDGRADVVLRFGDSAAAGGHGGTGIGLHGGAVYAEESDRIVRYPLAAGAMIPSGAPTTVVGGLPLGGDHPMHPFAIDSAGGMYVDVGSVSNACQRQNRTLRSPGVDPCTELLTRGGLWKFDANRSGQRFTRGARYATGLRNGEGLAFEPTTGKLYATQHGRDQLSANWPSLFTDAQSAELPAEEVVQVNQGDDFGWPYCYFDQNQRRLVLAPEYGGNGHTVGRCATKKGPATWFPGHWAPMAMVFYTGSSFPAQYRNGAFIAFHGSWNRAPLPEAGFRVVFVPFANGAPATPGRYENFATGFAPNVPEPVPAAYRPAGVAVGPHGALYVTDDAHGRVWRITYRGAAAAPAAPGRAP